MGSSLNVHESSQSINTHVIFHLKKKEKTHLNSVQRFNEIFVFNELWLIYTHPSLFAGSYCAISQIRGVAVKNKNTSLGSLN